MSDPNLHAWASREQPARYLAKEVPAGEKKALACYGLWLPDSQEMLLRFVVGRPVSAGTEAFLEWLSAQRYQAGKRALLLVWDNASWHSSERVRTWLKEHNRQVKAGEKQGVRLVVCWLPKRSPWLNPIEPKWLHGKRAVADPHETLEEVELMARVLEHFDCPVYPLLSTKVS